MAISKVAGIMLAGGITVGGVLSISAITNSDGIVDGVDGFKEKIQTLWQGNNTLKELLEGRDALLAKLTGEANDKIQVANGKIADANATIKAKLTEIGVLKQQVADKDAEISNLQAQLESEGGSNAELQSQLDEVKTDKARLEKELEMLNQYVQKVNAELEEQGITEESIQVNAEDYQAGTYEIDEVADTTTPTTPEETTPPSEDTSNEDSTPVEEEPQEDLTPAQAIELELRTQENYDTMTAYGVDLIDQSNENWFFVDVVQTGTDYQGKPQVKLIYTVKDDARSLDGFAQLNEMGSGWTLKDYVSQQVNTIGVNHDVIVLQVRWETESGTLKSFTDSSGKIYNQ
jgi:hypothetical protein